MKTATIRELRNDFDRLLKRLEQGETIAIFKRGEHVADLVPKAAGKRKSLLGCTPSPFPIPHDIDDPVDVEWNAMTHSAERASGPAGQSVTGREQLEEQLLEGLTSGAAEPMTAARKKQIFKEGLGVG